MSHVPAYLKGRGRGRGGGAEEGRSHKAPPTVGRGRSQTVNGGGDGAPSGMWQSWSTSVKQTAVKENDKKTAEQKFQKASDENQEAIKRHLHDDTKGENSSSDEEDIGSDVLEKIFSTYSSTNDGDIGSAQDTLLHSFRSGTSACLVCIDTIRKTEPIWSCSGCCAIFHIQCIQKWVKDGVYQQVYRSDDDNIKPEDIPWHCPKCRLEYSQKVCPTRYLCFCGKVEDPEFDPWLVPHSCGQTCAGRLKPDCGHTCLLLCHPGACPPCPKTVCVECYCGNSTPAVRRCSARTWACGGVCGRQLACGQHVCPNTCHPGECAACPQTSSQACQCGKTKSVRPCASPQWQCDKTCGRGLSCGNHVCEAVCHSGPCGVCPRGGLRKCPCGKTVYDLPCTDDIPTCGDTCSKTLDCGLHNCVQRCHQGPCGACRQMTVKRCRCDQQKDKEIQCCKDYLCETKCTKLRDCGKHQCKRKCCDGNCPGCEQACNKLLSCKNHKCLSRCHRGRCYPCNQTVDLTCNCKASKITVPCGREKVTKPPRCNYKCQRPPACHHPERVPHRCHFMDCPPCRQICQKALANCNHVCPFTCHTAVKVKVKDNTPRAGPWEGGPRITEAVVDKPCPPCTVLMSIQCYGKHETGHFACSVVQPYQCGRPCGRQLACENHLCTMICHTVDGAIDLTMAGSTCQECELPCQFDRPDGCTHDCTRACHSGPCPPCTQMFRMRCHCQVTVQYIACHEWVVVTEKTKHEKKSCHGPCPKMLSCGHPCSFKCHDGPCSSSKLCEKKSAIRCKCRRQKRDVRCKDRDVELPKMQCDEKCKKEIDTKQKKEQEETNKKKEEEDRRQQAEVEEFERKMKGRKRKHRKQHEEVVQESFVDRNKKWLILCVGVVVLAVFTAYILNAT